MNSGFSCPNPACRHVFAADSVKGAATLKCPRCGGSFALRATSPQPPAPIPMAILLPPSPDENVVFDSSPGLVNKKPWHLGASRGGLSLNWVTIGAIGVVALVLLLGVVLGLRSLLRSIKEEEETYARDSRIHGFRFQFPDNPWARDHGLQKELQASVAMRRSDPSSWMVLLIKDYPGRTPTPQELVDEGVRRLREYFRDLEWDRQLDRPLAGVYGPVLHFDGERGGSPMEGECYTVVHNGCAYWFVTWAFASDREPASRGWQVMRDRLTLPK